MIPPFEFYLPYLWWIRKPWFFLSYNSICLYIICVKYRGERGEDVLIIYVLNYCLPLYKYNLAHQESFIYNNVVSDIYNYPLPYAFNTNFVQTNRILRKKIHGILIHPNLYLTLLLLCMYICYVNIIIVSINIFNIIQL